MEEVCADPCCSILLFPFLKKLCPGFMSKYLPFEAKANEIKKGAYVFQHDVLYGQRPSTFDPAKINYKVNKSNLNEVKAGMNLRIVNYRKLMKAFSIVSLILALICVGSLFCDTIWGIKVFFGLTSVFFFGATYVMKDEAVNKMKLYLMYINGDLYLEKKYKWNIYDDGCTMELEIDGLEPENDEESNIIKGDEP